MKNLIKFLIACLLVTACSDYEGAIYNPHTDQTGVGFTSGNSSVIIPEEGITVTVNVQSTSLSTSDRNFDVSVDEASDGSSADYSFGSVVIPADSYDGALDVTFNNFNNMEDFVAFTLKLNLSLPDDVALVGSESVTFSYLKEIICNDFELVINEDNWGSERDWEIVNNDTGEVVVTCADHGCPFDDVSGGEQNVSNFILDDGCYTFTILDSFGDGLFDGDITGSYTLSCSIIIHASGGGNFGSSESTVFCVNQ